MKRTVLLLILCLVVAVSGCAQPQPETTLSMVADLFGNTASLPSEDNISTPATEETVPTPSFDSISSITEYGLPEYQLDEIGHYVAYEGGEMHLPYSFTYSGSKLSECGIAIMLFLDGQLQPFRTSENDTLQNVHILYPEESTGSKTVTLDLIFTPVAGSSGDTFDLTILSRQCPTWKWEHDPAGISEDTSSITTRLKLFHTPPDPVLPAVHDRLISWSCEYTDASHSEYKAWEGNSMAKLSACMRISGTGYTTDDSLLGNQYLFSVTPDTPMELTMELLNTSGVEYGIVVFVDNQPISVEPDDLIIIDATPGQKANLTVQVDMSTFEEYSRVYAVVVPRNYLATFGYTSEEVFDVTTTDQVYLFSAHSWAESLK